ncbi:hypothetical protein HUJ04_002508 [Dendroctonus ponderosae]|nr:hypothetical protein HUJ04_002508 [Dendroctonus ponderosae]
MDQEGREYDNDYTQSGNFANVTWLEGWGVVVSWDYVPASACSHPRHIPDFKSIKTVLLFAFESDFILTGIEALKGEIIDGKVAGEARFSILDISYNMSRHPQKRLEFSDTGAFTECNIGAKSKIY